MLLDISYHNRSSEFILIFQPVLKSMWGSGEFIFIKWWKWVMKEKRLRTPGVDKQSATIFSEPGIYCTSVVNSEI